MQMKTCSKCKKEMPATLEYFGIDKRRKYGLHSHCKECQKNTRQERYAKWKEEGIVQQFNKNNRLYSTAQTLKKRGYPDITKNKLQEIINNFKNDKNILICPYCGREMKDLSEIHIDHFVPFSKSPNEVNPLNNLIPVCKYCNRSKWNESFTEWYPKQVFYSKEREERILKYLGYTKDGNQQLTIAI